MKNTHYLIGNAHIDPVWQWCVPEGLSLIKSTFRSALDRMNEYPNYKFTSACASYYQWIQSSEPEMFEEIKQRIKEGRWSVSGGMWVQPDCNIPSGEAFCRHLLYSQEFFKKTFGQIIKTSYNVDSFGHNAMLPQLLKKSGIDNYVYMRPNREVEKPSLPKNNLHIWQSPDGSSVKAFRILDSYTGNLSDERIARYDEQEQDQMIFYGIGNHGGGPSKQHLESAEELVKDPRFKYAVPDEYFNEVSLDKAPLITEDLQHHASGCYSANSAIKAINRKTENELVCAEKLDVLSNILTGSKTHEKELAAAWQRVMFNQFHDILAGCSIKESYADAFNGYGFAGQTALEVNTFASQRISWRINTTNFLNADISEMRNRLWEREGEGSPIVVFNSHSFDVKATACFGTQGITRVVDHNGKDVAFQLVRASYTDSSFVNKCLFEADVPAYGYAVYYLYRNEENSSSQTVEKKVKAGKDFIENEKLYVKLNPETGAIISLINKKNNEEFADGELGKAIICDDFKNDTWAHKATRFNDDIAAFGQGTLEVLESGPIRATIKSVVKYNNSVLKRYYSLYSGSDRVCVRCIFDFDEEYKLAKLSFKAKIDEPLVTYSMPYGFISKEANGEEEPSHAWADIHDKTGRGIGFINDSKYSFCSDKNDFRMMIARSCAYLDHFADENRDNEMEFLDKGEQEFNYEIMPHLKEEKTKLFKAAQLLNTPIQVQQETHHTGSLPASFSGISVDKDNVVITAIKPAQDGNGLILRIIECAGKETTAAISFKALNCSFEISLKTQEIKTVRISQDGKITEELIIE